VFPVDLHHFIYWVSVLELLKIFAQNLHIYHGNDSTSACIMQFIYILVLEDIIGSDVGGVVFYGPHCTSVWHSASTCGDGYPHASPHV